MAERRTVQRSPRVPVPRPIAAVDRRRPISTAPWPALLGRRGRRRRRPRWARSSSPIPIGPDLHPGAFASGWTREADARLSSRRRRPGPSVHRRRARARRDVRPRGDRRRPAAPFVGAYLPLLVASGGVETALGSIGFGWPAPRDARRRRARDARPRSPRSRRWRSTGRGSRRRPPSAPSGSSGWPTRDPLTGLANERTVGARSSSSSSRVPAARAARSRSRCSTSTTSRRRTATAATPPATTSCVGSRPSSPSRSGSSTPSDGSAATSSSSSRPGRPGMTVAQPGHGRDRRPSGRRRQGRVRVRPASPGSRSTARDAESLIAARPPPWPGRVPRVGQRRRDRGRPRGLTGSTLGAGQRLESTAAICGVTRRRRRARVASTTTKRSGDAAASARNPSRTRRWNARSNSASNRVTSSGAFRASPTSDRQVEQDRQVRSQAIGRDVRERASRSRASPAPYPW